MIAGVNSIAQALSNCI